MDQLLGSIFLLGSVPSSPGGERKSQQSVSAPACLDSLMQRAAFKDSVSPGAGREGPFSTGATVALCDYLKSQTGGGEERRGVGKGRLQKIPRPLRNGKK